MIAALDASYDEKANRAKAAAVVFDCWETETPTAEYIVEVEGIQPYVPGQFFRRELPCLLAVMEQITEPLEVVVVDGFVRLGDRPGLGMHLWEALGKTITVVGVAKTRFHGANAVEITRGRSRTSLFVSAVGVDDAKAAECVMKMAGEYRMPSLLKRLDRLTKG